MRLARTKLLALAMITAMVAVLAPMPAASATVFDDEAVNGAWYATGTVWAVDVSGDIIYFGGSFDATQNPAGGGSGQGKNVAAISRITGQLIMPSTSKRMGGYERSSPTAISSGSVVTSP